MPDSRDVSRLMAEAAVAPNGQETRRLVGEAENLRTELATQASRDREVDLSNAIVMDHLTPVRVHEHHTAATDWLGEIDTAPDAGQMQNDILAQASLWYGKTASMIKERPDEFEQQAWGQARKLAGAYGSLAQQAEDLFLGHIGGMHEREVRTGTITLVADDMPTAGGQPGPDGTFPTGAYPTALDGEATSSERAPQIEALEGNGANNNSGSDVVPVNDPGLGQSDPTAEQINKGASMQSAPCPACGGHGRVAVRRSATQKEGFSGLPQLDQVVDPSDTQVQQTPYPAQVAFPWLMNPGNVEQAINETEQQLAEREQRKGASRKAVEKQAQAAAAAAYRQVLAAGYDDSGWAGDMGAGGYSPGQQDFNPQPSSNLGQPDPVYGQGGDQGNRPMKPYGADEATDETNQPAQWAPGQPTQMDLGGQVNSTQAPAGPGFPNPPINGKQSSVDPEIAKAERFIAQRKALLAQQNR